MARARTECTWARGLRAHAGVTSKSALCAGFARTFTLRRLRPGCCAGQTPTLDLRRGSALAFGTGQARPAPDPLQPLLEGFRQGFVVRMLYVVLRKCLFLRGLGAAIAPRAGLEPATGGLEGRCSVRLSYRGLPIRWSGRPDLNRRPSAPKADALTGLRYAPKTLPCVEHGCAPSGFPGRFYRNSTVVDQPA